MSDAEFLAMAAGILPCFGIFVVAFLIVVGVSVLVRLTSVSDLPESDLKHHEHRWEKKGMVGFETLSEDSWYARFTDRYECEDCGQTEDRTITALY